MGRSGGFGGGGFSGGFGSGGGHFSGGFGGGGGRSSFGGSGFSGGGGYHHHSSGSGDFLTGVLLGNLLSNNGGGSGGGSYGGGSGNGGGNGGYTPEPQRTYTPPKPDIHKKSKIVFAITVFLFVVLGMFSCATSLVTAVDGIDSSQYQITHEREALSPIPAGQSSYFEDRDGDWIYAPSDVNKAMRYFEAETGVTPYLVILPNGSYTTIDQLQQLADELYDEKFDDETGFVLAFCDDGRGYYKCGYSIGSAAATVVDQEAMDIMSRYLDRNYNNSSISESEIFANTYGSTADAIMVDLPDAEAAAAEAEKQAEENSALMGLPFLVLLIGGGCTFIIYVVENREAAKKKREEEMKEILSTPLEKFSDNDSELAELAKKYEDGVDIDKGDTPSE